MIIEKTKKVERIIINELERCKFYICCYYKKVDQIKDIKLRRYELMNAAEKVIQKKSDIIYLFKLYDQFSLFKKISLSEENRFMLDNREKQNIYTQNKSKKEIMEIDIAKFYEKKDKLIKYLKENKNNLNLVDKLLYNYLDESLKSEIKID